MLRIALSRRLCAPLAKAKTVQRLAVGSYQPCQRRHYAEAAGQKKMEGVVCDLELAGRFWMAADVAG